MVHSFYSSRNPSGENTVVEAELTALRRAGHDAFLVAAHTDEQERTRLYPQRAALRVATGRGHNPLSEVQALAPDLVHVHNLFPNFARAWVRQVTVPIVHTLHNYRPLCANAMLLRDGKVCTLCPDGDRWAGVRYRCYRDSRLATIPLAWANRNGPGADPLLQRADRLVALSERQRSVLVAAGVPPGKIEIGSNFLPEAMDPGAGQSADARGWLFVGRLSEEKGIVQLLRRWPEGEPLTIVGDGPQRALVEEQAARVGAQLVGSLPRTEVLSRMRTAWGLVFPSIWYEAAPMVYLEALATGLPIVAFEPNVVAEFVVADGTGVVTTWDGDTLETALRDLKDRRTVLQERCRSVFDKRYSEEAYTRRVTRLYERLCQQVERFDAPGAVFPHGADSTEL